MDRDSQAVGSSGLALSRERIVTAVVELLDQHGIGWLSMRKLASEIGVAPMSLYTHVRSKEDLLDAALGHTLNAISVEIDGEADWQEQTFAFMRSLRHQLHRHPWVVPLMGSPARISPGMLRASEVAMRIVLRAGYRDASAVMCCRILLWTAVSYVMLEIEAPPIPELRDRDGENVLPKVMAAVPAEEAPLLHENQHHFMTVDRNEQYEATLRHLVAGLAAEAPQA